MMMTHMRKQFVRYEIMTEILSAKQEMILLIKRLLTYPSFGAIPEESSSFSSSLDSFSSFLTRFDDPKLEGLSKTFLKEKYVE